MMRRKKGRSRLTVLQTISEEDGPEMEASVHNEEWTEMEAVEVRPLPSRDEEGWRRSAVG